MAPPPRVEAAAGAAGLTDALKPKLVDRRQASPRAYQFVAAPAMPSSASLRCRRWRATASR
ncbi:MAG: hypothetical protein MZV49_16855 [Rhodopseudomonas palustris]|nr:hypothetical protein [Rhodopseudomonas palustris]